MSFIFVLLFGLYIFLVTYGVKQNKRRIKLFLILFVAGLSIMAYLFVPDNTYDLYRHFLYMDEIRHSGYSLQELLFQAFNRNQTIGRYPTLITWNVLRDVLAQIDNNHLLPMVCTAISYSVFAYIVYDWFNSNGFSFTKILLTIFVMFSLLPVLMVVSGIRNATAFALVSLGIYKWLYQKKSVVLFLILGLVSVFLHTSSVVPIVIALLARFVKGIKSIVIIAIAFLSLTMFMNYAVNSNIPVLRDLAERFLYFNEDYKYGGEKLNYICCLVTCVICLLPFVLNADFKKMTRIENFVFTYLIVLLSSVLLNSTAFLTRLSYIIAYLSPIAVCPILKNNRNRFKLENIFKISLYSVSAISIVYYIIPFLAALF